MAQAYGSITLVDVSDLGQLSVVPESNLPLSVVYDPDSTTYNPNWGVDHLKLKPVIYYGGKSLSPTDNGVSVSWKQQINSGEPTNITIGSVNEGILTITENPFNENNTIYTYIVTVVYVDSKYGVNLTAQGKISFTLTKNASKVRTLKVVGDSSAFLYKGDKKTIIGKNSIKLTAIYNNINIVGWEYLNEQKVWTTIYSKDSAAPYTSTTLTINATDNYFFDNMANIKITGKSIGSDNEELYDQYTIVKLYDGAAGTSIVSAVLSNDDQMLAADKEGNVNNYRDAVSTITIYSGNENVTESFNITAVADSGITGALVGATYTVSTVTPEFETGSITFTCTPKPDSKYTETIIKKFTLTKIKTGADGITPTIYSLGVSALAINKSTTEQGVIYTPSTLAITPYQQTGQNKSLYKGRIRILKDGDDENPIVEGDYDTYNFEFASQTILNKLIVQLYEAGSSSTLLDSQTIVITTDGADGEKGDQGDPGVDSLNLVMGNYSDVIPCSNDGKVLSNFEYEINYSVYKGITQIPGKLFSNTSLPEGITIESSQATANSSGKITLKFEADKDLGKEETGIITFTFQALDLKNNVIGTINKNYSWTKNLKAKDGKNAVVFEIYAPEGNIINNGENEVVLKARITDGANVITGTDLGKTTWTKYEGSGYTEVLESESNGDLIITKEKIDSYASIKCDVTYGGVDYSAFFSVYDKDDPLQITIRSTVGEKIINSVGKGMIYALVYRNNEEIDKMPTMSYGEESSKPEEPGEDTYFWLLDSSNKKVILQKYTNGTWIEDISKIKGVYTWNLIDEDGNLEGNVLEGKAIYVDSDVINKKKTFNLQVTI